MFLLVCIDGIAIFSVHEVLDLPLLIIVLINTISTVFDGDGDNVLAYLLIGSVCVDGIYSLCSDVGIDKVK